MIVIQRVSFHNEAKEFITLRQADKVGSYLSGKTYQGIDGLLTTT